MHIWFSSDGENYESEAEKLVGLIDASSSVAETISIPLQSRIGRFVKMEFDLAAKWLLLSEITFHTGKEFIYFFLLNLFKLLYNSAIQQLDVWTM